MKKHVYTNHVEYTCTKCGKFVVGKIQYKSLNKEPVCRNCQTLERTGYVNNFQREDIKEKSRKTNLEKYGVENVQQSKEIQEKAKKTKLERYGVGYVLQSDEFKEKVKRTSLERYGSENVFASKEIKEKIRQVNKERLGVEFPMQSENVKNTLRKNNLEKYGVPYWFLSQERYEVEKIRRNSEQHVNWKIEVARRVGYVFLDRYLRSDEETVIRFLCPKCGKEFDWCLKDDPRHAFCKECAKNGCSSMKEIRVRDYIREILNDETISKDRKILNGREVDIYVPKFNIAIEFDGVYWHNDKVSDKYELCAEKGIRLIQINEYEWDNKESLVKSYLKSTFGIFDRKIFARKCKVKTVSNEEYRYFVEENHLQGFVRASVIYGLYYKNELVQIMSFGKPRYGKYEHEMMRECSKAGIAVIGGKERLFKHFLRDINPKSIVSYCERNKFSGKSYERIGFKLDHISNPGYRYYKDDGSISREKAQKHKLKDLLEDFNPEMTEKENMLASGYTILYDYGNFVFTYENK